MKAFFVLCVALVAGIHAATSRSATATLVQVGDVQQVEQMGKNVTLPPTQQDKALKTAAECIKETGVSKEVLAEAKKGHFTEDEGLKKFVFCFFNKAGIVDAEGKIDVEQAVNKLPPGVNKDEARKVLEDCKSKSGKTKEDRAFEIFKCYRAGIKDHIIPGF